MKWKWICQNTISNYSKTHSTNKFFLPNFIFNLTTHPCRYSLLLPSRRWYGQQQRRPPPSPAMPSPSLDKNHERVSYLLPPSRCCTSCGCRQYRHMIRWPPRCWERDRSCHCHHPPSEPPWHWYLDPFLTHLQNFSSFSSTLFSILIVVFIIYLCTVW